jgi:hypothetical protein
LLSSRGILPQGVASRSGLNIGQDAENGFGWPQPLLIYFRYTNTFGVQKLHEFELK